MASDEDLTSFIRASFRSVWSLEVLCHLQKAPQHAHSPDEIISSLRASDLVVRHSLAELAAAGLIVVGEDGGARYAPANERLAVLAAAAEARYTTAPDASPTVSDAHLDTPPAANGPADMAPAVNGPADWPLLIAGRIDMETVPVRHPDHRGGFASVDLRPAAKDAGSADGDVRRAVRADWACRLDQARR